MGKSAKDFNIPDDWLVSTMLKNLLTDYGGGPDTIATMDDGIFRRIVALTAMGHIELAEKLAWLIEKVEHLAEHVDDTRND